MSARSGQIIKLKRITNFNQEKFDIFQVGEISHLPDQEQAEAIAESFLDISNEYELVKKKDNISIPLFSKSSILQFKPQIIRKYLKNIKTRRDTPSKIIKEFALFLCVPMSDIINTGESLINKIKK